MLVRMALESPLTYQMATSAAIARVSNGCGPQCWKFDLIPDSFIGVDVSPACDIHDWMYVEGKTEEDRLKADKVFLRNLRTLVRRRGGFFFWLRMLGALLYYVGVRRHGRTAFESVSS